MTTRSPWRRAWFWLNVAAAIAFFGWALTACTKHVQWEEEVPLNTGETIVVKRSGTYTYKSAPGNPLDFGWGPEWRSTIEFTYKGKVYSHTSEAFINTLAIDPNGVPSLVASAGVWGNQNKYPCVTPYYAQFKPDSTGFKWQWPERIETWLYNLSTNLLIGLAPISADGKKLKQDDRQNLNASILVFDEYKRIDPGKKPENCMRSN